MGDKSPKAKNKNKKQGEMVKDKQKSAASRKDAANNSNLVSGAVKKDK